MKIDALDMFDWLAGMELEYASHSHIKLRFKIIPNPLCVKYKVVLGKEIVYFGTDVDEAIEKFNELL